MNTLFSSPISPLSYRGNDEKLKFQMKKLDESDWFSASDEKEKLFQALMSADDSLTEFKIGEYSVSVQDKNDISPIN